MDLMTAKEMFKELGFKQTTNNVECIKYFRDDDRAGCAHVVFDLLCETIKPIHACDYELTLDELKAINQQCKELGWLEEEKSETNCEHYKEEIGDIGFDFALRDGEVVPCKSCLCEDCFFNDSHIKCFVARTEWLLQKHGEKYKLTQFEYDLLRASDVSHKKKLKEVAIYNTLKKIGYFKDIDFELAIYEILNNCEVIEND